MAMLNTAMRQSPWYIVHAPWIVRALFNGFVWTVPTKSKELFLTFDDGPVPSVTPWVLDTLAEHGAKATFFCIGRNCELHPELFARIRQEGHAVGNHTYDHIRGLRTSKRSYLRNVLQCQALTGTRLFRPPYLSISRAQYAAMKKRYDVVLCDVLSGDFDTAISGEQCWRNVRPNVKPGSIVIFHDSLKGEERLRYVLPRTLAHFAEQGYSFRALEGG
ncbi:MAG TPA: polysaccharide deacetylase family protein [Flavobacteriales bacterium]|jgi:peptidoglycan/xylan/chitin deacetylase (PgdA/CDA1 family)|nr:polysaccharide deacetylase family protein [Flavobacteriales bacterium]